MKLYCTHFNFCRGHGGLRYKDERGVECKKHLPEKQDYRVKLDFKGTTDI
jgi:hypothetical protein